MSNRDATFRKFGPLLVEALFDTLLELHNELREELGKPQIPKSAFLGKSNNNQNHLEPYNWMSEEP